MTITAESLPADATLVEAWRRHDRAAAELLLGRHRPLLLALCRRMLGDRDLAEDAVQEACALAFSNVERLRRPDRFGAWLAGIGLNVCRRWLRERAEGAWSWEALLGGQLRAGLPDPAPSPEEAAEAAEVAARVRAAVATLPPGQRAAVTRFYLAGLTHAEIAEELGLTVGAVKSRLHKARAGLREDLWPVWKEELMPTPATSGLVDMKVVDVWRLAADEQRPERSVVLLEEVDGTRQLPIWIGPAEATALAVALEGVELPRPGPYEFASRLVGASGGRLREVRVDRLIDGTFYATVMVEGPGGAAEVDARPSDALNLALVAGAPVRVDADVIARCEEWARAHTDLGLDSPTERAAGIVAQARREWEEAARRYEKRSKP